MSWHFGRTVIIASSVLGLGSCAITSSEPVPTLPGSEWVLAALSDQPLVENAAISIRFGDEDVSGTDGCNRYTGGYRAVDGTLQIDATGPATLMACAPEVEAQARDYRAALQNARRYAVEAGRLQVLGDAGDVLMVFDQQAQVLAGTAWRVTGYANGRGGVSSVMEGTSLSVAFRPDGSVSGSAGCNVYRASFRQQAGALTFGPMAVTRRLCAQPDGVMEQEQAMLAALESVASVAWEAGRLRLLSGTGAVALQLALEPDGMARVTGTVSYRERMALPPASVLTLRLVNVSKADAPAVLVAEQQLEVGSRSVPLTFAVPYATEAIDPRERYALQARIDVDGELLFISDQHHAVITHGAPVHVDLLLKRVGGDD